MNELILAPGDMKPTDFEVTTPEQIREIGSELLEWVIEMKSRRGFMLEELVKVQLVDSRETSLGVGLLSNVHDFYQRLLQNSGVNFTHHVTSLIHGMYDHLAWHIDKVGDVRFMLNTGEDTYIDIADEWDLGVYKPGYPRDVAPLRSSPLQLPTGVMYAANNLVTDQSRLLRPHQNPLQENRIMLRTCFYAEAGWENHASNGGIPVLLSNL